MNLKKRLALGVLISTLLAFSAYYAEYLPFTGKWIAAYRMDRYAQEQYPGFHCGKVYFNPCGAPYEAVLTGDSGQEVELGCGYDGLIGDPLPGGTLDAEQSYLKSNVGTQPAGTGKLRQCKLPVAI